MARGRKKGGLDINSLNDNKEITDMIINQINSLNKKIKKFKKENVSEHEKYVKAMITEDMVKFTKTGTLSKSKKFYDDKNTVWLKKTLAALHKINNHYAYGTVKKYKDELNKSMKLVKNYTDDYLKNKGYDDNFIKDVLKSKDFYVKLFDEFQNVGVGYTSEQAIDKIALSYNEDSGFSEDEKNKILNNIEYSRNTINRLVDEQNAFEEFKRNKKKR